MDVPLPVHMTANSQLSVRVHVGNREAQRSTYVIGVTDGVWLWFYDVSRTAISPLLWYMENPYTTPQGSSAQPFGSIAQDESAAIFTLTFAWNRWHRSNTYRVQRGAIDNTGVMPPARIWNPGAGMRLVMFSRVPDHTLTFNSVRVTSTTARDVELHTDVWDFDAVDVARLDAAWPAAATSTLSADASVVTATSATDWQTLVAVPLPRQPPLVNQTTGVRLGVVVSDTTDVSRENDVAVGLSNGTHSWVGLREEERLSAYTLTHGGVGGAVVAAQLVPGSVQPSFADDSVPISVTVQVDAATGVFSGWMATTETSSEWTYTTGTPTGTLFAVVMHHGAPATHTLSMMRLETTADDVVAPDAVLATTTIVAPAFTNQLLPVTVTLTEPLAADLLAAPGGTVVQSVGAATTALRLTTNRSTIELDFDLLPQVQGRLRCWVPVGAIQDGIGNRNRAASNVIDILYDTVPPRQTFTTAIPAYANATSIGDRLVHLNVSEPPVLLSSDVLHIVNGVPSPMEAAAGPGTPYGFRFTVTPYADGVVNITMPAAAYPDRATNRNVPSHVSFVYDTTPPVPHLYAARAPFTNASAVDVVLTFSEDVLGDVTPAVLNVTNGAVSEFTVVARDLAGVGTAELTQPWPWTWAGQGAVVVTFVVTPATNGTVTVQVPAGVVTDYALNPNVPSVVTSVLASPPQLPDVPVRVPAPPTPSPVPSPSSFPVAYFQAINGTNATCTPDNVNATINGFNCSDLVFLEEPPPTPSPVPLAVDVHDPSLGTDRDRLLVPFSRSSTAVRFETRPLRFVFDAAPPVARLTTDTLEVAAVVHNFTLEFSELPVGFYPALHLLVDGAVLGALHRVPPSAELQALAHPGAGPYNPPAAWTFSVTPTRQGNVSVWVPDAAFVDRAGNVGASASVFAFHFDDIPPSVTINTSSPMAANQFTLHYFTLIFSERVWSVSDTNLEVDNLLVTRLIVAPDSPALQPWEPRPVQQALPDAPQGVKFELGVDADLPEGSGRGPVPIALRLRRLIGRDAAGNRLPDIVQWEGTFRIVTPPPPPIWPLVLMILAAIVGTLLLGWWWWTRGRHKLRRLCRRLCAAAIPPSPPPPVPKPPGPPPPPTPPPFVRGAQGIDVNMRDGDLDVAFNQVRNPFASLMAKNTDGAGAGADSGARGAAGRGGRTLLPSIANRQALLANPHKMRQMLSPGHRRKARLAARELRLKEERRTERAAARKAQRQAERKLKKLQRRVDDGDVVVPREYEYDYDNNDSNDNDNAV